MFVGGYKIVEFEGVSIVKFVVDFVDLCIKEWLVIIVCGVMFNIFVVDEEGIDFVDGGWIIFFDFDYSVINGVIKEFIIDVGMREFEVLEEEYCDMEIEVVIVCWRIVV